MPRRRALQPAKSRSPTLFEDGEDDFNVGIDLARLLLLRCRRRRGLRLSGRTAPVPTDQGGAATRMPLHDSLSRTPVNVDDAPGLVIHGRASRPETPPGPGEGLDTRSSPNGHHRHLHRRQGSCSPRRRNREGRPPNLLHRAPTTVRVSERARELEDCDKYGEGEQTAGALFPIGRMARRECEEGWADAWWSEARWEKRWPSRKGSEVRTDGGENKGLG